MMAQWGAWWRARTERERRLIQILMALVFLAALPLSLLQAASAYRVRGAADLAAARQTEADVAAIAAARPPASQALVGDGTLRGRLVALAQAEGLAVAAIEPLAGGRLRLTFGPSSSVAIYRWLAACAQAGVILGRAQILRAGEGDVVTAVVEAAGGP